MTVARRGEVWLVDLGMAAKVRPAVVVSVPAFLTTSWDDGHPHDFRVAELLTKYGLAGTVDQIKSEIAALRSIGGDGDLEWFGWFFDQGFMPWEEEVRQIELFAKHIIPAFR